MTENIDKKTVKSFGDEWKKFDQSDLSIEEADQIFNKYFSIFPWNDINDSSIGFDLGCGTGRWANLVASRVGHLNCIDPSKAIDVAKENLKDHKNISFFQESVDSLSIADESQDFGYSLGVLHHIPNTESALISCVKKLKTGSPMLLYLYYNFDNRSRFFKLLWNLSNMLRKIISIMPSAMKHTFTDLLAVLIYLPLARISYLIEKCGFNVSSFPLSFYRNLSFYTMRTDSRDRFGTPLEQRFSKNEIKLMMQQAGLENIKFRESSPYWCAIGNKK